MTPAEYEAEIARLTAALAAESALRARYLNLSREHEATMQRQSADVARLTADAAVAWADCHDGTCNACAKCCDAIRARMKVLEEALRRLDEDFARHEETAKTEGWNFWRICFQQVTRAALSPAIDTGARADSALVKAVRRWLVHEAGVGKMKAGGVETWCCPGCGRGPDGAHEAFCIYAKLIAILDAAPNSPAGAETQPAAKEEPNGR